MPVPTHFDAKEYIRRGLDELIAAKREEVIKEAVTAFEKQVRDSVGRAALAILECYQR